MSKDVLQFVREDDFVEYYLFPKLNKNIETIEEENLILHELLNKVLASYESYAKGYIWQKDEFNVTPYNRTTQLLKETDSAKGAIPIHLFGVTHYGDNIQDEWFIVSLLFELTKQIQDLIVRVVDSDGEFLLIEAAEFLPRWATPDTCEQRVYIYNGSLHIIPHKPNDIKMKEDCSDSDNDSEDEDCPLTNIIPIKEALDEIYEKFDLTMAPDAVQVSIKNRIIDYPNNISKYFHQATIYIPVAIAKILDKEPKLIAPAVHAFCNRDVVDLKACRAMKYFPPENRIYYTVKFTKCLYAMLLHNNFNPDRRTGWKLPQVSCKEYKAHSLGVRVACGFEILASQAKTETDFETDKAWITYLEKLKEKCYFKNLIEKSDSYNKLLNEAKEYYMKNRDSMKVTPTIGKQIVDLLKNVDSDTDYNEIKKDISDFPPDDDESWLNITSEDLDEIMRKRYGQDCQVFSTKVNSSDLTNKISDFLDHRSGIEGVEFTEDSELQFDIPIKPKRGIFKNKDKASSSKQKSKSDSKVDFDPDAFACAVQNILDFKIPDENWDQSSDSEMSDYGDVQNNSDIDQNAFKIYMDQMDKELSTTTIGKSFKNEDVENDNFDEVEDFTPVNIDVNTLKSMVKSYEGEMGKSGPTSNLLSSIGIRLEPDMQVE